MHTETLIFKSMYIKDFKWPEDISIFCMTHHLQLCVFTKNHIFQIRILHAVNSIWNNVSILITCRRHYHL